MINFHLIAKMMIMIIIIIMKRVMKMIDKVIMIY